eukprot:3838990-Pyramimonas_sp.AAC.1
MALAARPLANRWRQVHGPASAVLATLGRLGWHWPAYHTFTTHTGYCIDLRRTAPSALKGLATARLEAVELTEWATARGLSSVRPFLEHARAALRQRRNPPGRQQAILAFVRKSFWAQGK